ncbi:LytR/AlgR family response regulator transcription factor [Kordia jejudonensis]|uniref:LytR/AlgR family response regulator transcription factor n=1 Tax=Kordia jejudonensis TaxID=1348245 RepID=UPI00069A377B|nr:LytTR family DNA-binding domain-containing protein [Kordia jejudonensis]
MISKIIKYLQEPYPYIYKNTKYLVFVLLLIVILSFLFSYTFDPFEVNVDEHKIAYVWILWIHAALPFPIAFGYFLVLNSVVKDDSRWILGKELFHLFFLLILIGIGSFLVRDIIYDNSNNWSFHYLIEEVRNSFLVGALLLLIILPLNLERLIRKHSKTLEGLQLKTPTTTVSSQRVQIPHQAETYEFDIEQFLFAKVESNYTEIYIHDNAEVKKGLFRITLKELETHLEKFPHIYKTHRSYLVNLHKIIACVGNAQGYQLSLRNYSKTVPVSRSKLKEFNAYFALIS